MSNWDDDEDMESLPSTSEKTTEPRGPSDQDSKEVSNAYNEEGASCLQQEDVGAPNQSMEEAPMNPLQPTPSPQDIDETRSVAPSAQPDNKPTNEPPRPEVSTGARRRDPHYNLRGRFPNPNPPQDRGGYQHNRRNQVPFKLSNRKSILIPSRVTGMLIGRRGQTIHEYEKEANVIMQVGLSDGNQTDLIIYGTDEAIAKAENMIKNLVRDNTFTNFQQPSSSANTINLNTKFIKTNSNGEQVIDWDNLNRHYQAHQQERRLRLLPMNKDFYKEDPAVAGMPPEEVADWRNAYFEMQVRRNSVDALVLRPVPNPVLTFQQAFAEYPAILKKMYQLGFEKPFPIQRQSLPVLLRGDDFICTAPSGTGKTLAIIFSAIIHVVGQPIPKANRKSPIVLFLAPNRKHVLQIQKELIKFQHADIYSLSLYKEGDRNNQTRIINKVVDIFVCTPEILSEMVTSKYVQVINFTYVALFEADTMLNKGYESTIRKCLFDMRPDKQMVMTCACWSTGVRVLALSYMKDPIQLKLGSIRNDAIAHSVTQRVQFVEEAEKINVLMQFLRNINKTDKVIIFCGNTATATYVSQKLASEGIESRILHGEISATDREAALRDVINGTVNVLLATNVASRSISMQQFSHIINFDYPGQIEEYVQRITRTGRGNSSIALTCVTRNDWAHAHDLILILEEAKQTVPEELEEMAKRFEAMNMVGKDGRGWRDSDSDYPGRCRRK